MEVGQSRGRAVFGYVLGRCASPHWTKGTFRVHMRKRMQEVWGAGQPEVPSMFFPAALDSCVKPTCRGAGLGTEGQAEKDGLCQQGCQRTAPHQGWKGVKWEPLCLGPSPNTRSWHRAASAAGAWTKGWTLIGRQVQGWLTLQANSSVRKLGCGCQKCGGCRINALKWHESRGFSELGSGVGMG